MTQEELLIPRYEVVADIESGLYSVCDQGFVFNNKTGRRLKSYINKKKKGYEYVKLRKEGVTKSFHIGVLVAKAFIPNPENKKTVNHLDGDKLNNHFTNLKWATHKENSQHAFKTGLGKSGLTHYSSKFSLEDVIEIRELSKLSLRPFEISRIYNVSETAISNLINGLTYKNVPAYDFDLLRPRFEVVELYPFSPYKVGTIITTGVNSALYRMITQFNSVFRPLAWWEKRAVEDMPEYVKHDGERDSEYSVGGVKMPTMFKVKAHFRSNIHDNLRGHSKDYFVAEWSENLTSLNYGAYLPATEQEYIDYQKSITP